MPYEAQAPVDYRALCEAEGWPPIRGGSPELDEATADEAPDAAPQDEGLPAESESKDADQPDYRQRFEDLQPQLTRAQQQNAEYNRLFEAARRGDPQALEALGVEFEEEEDEYVDPDEQLRQELAQLKEQVGTQQQQAERAQQEEAEAEYIATNISRLEKETGIELDDEAVDFVIDHARMNRGADNAPAVEAAFKKFTSVAKASYERYLQSKKSASRAPVGGPGEEKIDLSDDDQRQAAMLRDMEAEEGSDT